MSIHIHLRYGFFGHVWFFATLWTAACQASLSFTISHSLLKLMSIESVMPSSHLILCCTLLLLFSIFPSIKVYPNELALHIRWPKYWSFSFSIIPSKEIPGLISFRTDWLDLLAVQRTRYQYIIVDFQSLSRVQLFAMPWTAACQASLSFTIFQSLLKFTSIELEMSSNHLILCHSLLFLPSIFPSIRVFSSDLALCIRRMNYWSFSTSPSNEYSGLNSC